MRTNSEIVDIIVSLYKSKGWSLSEFSRKIDIPKSSLSRYFNKSRQFPINKIDIFSTALGVKSEDILGISSQSPKISQEIVISKLETTSPTLEAISETSKKLKVDGQKKALDFVRNLLEEQTASERPMMDIQIVSETFKVYYTSAAKAGPTGFGYDDYEMDFTYSDQEPPRHDIATMVDGDSMNPDYADGDILYLRDYGASFYDGQECVVVIDDKSYFKKLYTTNTGLRLVSTNPDKDTYPDFEIDFPPADGSHIKIFDVVGSFTPVEK